MEKLNTLDPKQEALNELKNETDKLTKDLKEELIGKPGEVTYLHESKDGNYKIYSYTVKTGGNLGGIKNQYENQIGTWVEGTHFTDNNGDRIRDNDNLKRGDIVFLRVPKTPIPNMTKDDILKMPIKFVDEISAEYDAYYHSEGPRPHEYEDDKGCFLLYHGKKFYTYIKHGELNKTNLPIYSGDGEDGGTACTALSIKDGNKYYGIYCDYEVGKNYKGELERGRGINDRTFRPKNYEKRCNQ